MGHLPLLKKKKMMVNKVILCICAGFMALLPLAAQFNVDKLTVC